MNCQSCGAPLAPGASFCARCGRPAATTSLRAFRRPGVVTLLAVLNFVGAGLAFAGSAAIVIATLASREKEAVPLVAFALLYGVIALVQLATGIGLWNLRSWGRTLQLVLAFIGLLGIPCGTIISILILIYLFKPGVRILFSERSPRELSAPELAEVSALGESSTALVVIGGIVVAVALVAVVGIVAAIAIPSLLRARVSANESAAIGDIRTLISAQMTYASANNGFYDSLECLNAPARCIPGYPDSGPLFLDAELAAAGARRGYERTFHPGPPAAEEVVAMGKISPSSLTAFAYVAMPQKPGQTGVRAFCGDSTGRICFTSDGSPPPIEDGLCAMTCPDLR